MRIGLCSRVQPVHAVLPEVERQIARREELAEDGKYASAAGKELEKVVAAVELATGGY